MTKEELKQKCEERVKIFQQAMESCKSSSPMDCIEWFADRIVELEAQIEKMKCCSNCNHFNKESDIEYCQNCERLLVNSLDNFPREEIIKDEWELKEIKENELY